MFLGTRTIPQPFPGCGVDETEDDLGCDDHPSCFSTTLVASDVVGSADWSAAVTQTVQMLEHDDGTLAFSPADLTFEAGVPVILTLESSASNTSKHYYTAEEFYKSVAWRKAQTSHGEYKAPYFKAFELLVGGRIELYFVPVEAGVYDVDCTLRGHAARGMVGTITVTPSPAGLGFVEATVDQEVSAAWNSQLDSDERLSGSHDVWATAQTVQVDMVETDDGLAFSTTPRYAKDQGYILRLANPAGNASKHYYTASSFYRSCVTRKAQDSDAEIKAPYFKAVELLVDDDEEKSLELFLVPTVAGSYSAICTIRGHEAAGMSHTFEVDEVGTTASELVRAATWPSGPTHTVTMVEDWPNLSFDPPTLNFAVGEPAIVRITNPSGNTSKHYYTAAEFYKTVAWRKAQTSHGEYKAPYFKAFEMKTGSSGDTNIDLYFVPQIAGTYDVTCTIGGHAAAGMMGSLVVTGDATSSLDLQVSPTWEKSLDKDPRLSGSHDVWSTAQTVQVDMVETDDGLAFSTTPRYAKDQGYILRLANPAGNASKHYYTASSFYRSCVTRKAQDSDAEIKAPYFKAVELLVDDDEEKSLELFLVPTVAGSYSAICTIRGHEAAGMSHTFEVDEVGTTASELVRAATWPSGPTHTVTMVEDWPNLSFDPPTLNFAVGEPAIVRITNPSGNTSKHYYTAAEFYKTVAWRKAQTSHGEYKAPYFKAFEMKTGSSGDTNIDLYFVPQIPGTYDVTCTIGGHAAAGMAGTLVVTGDATSSLDLQVSSTWDRSLNKDPRLSGSHDIWASATTLAIDIVEAPNFAFVPANPMLIAENGYIFQLTNNIANSGKHYYASPSFFETAVSRKAQDSDAEIKAPYFKAVELLYDAVNARSLEMFLVPTTAGSYPVVCTIPGHADAGMTGTITVR